MTGTGTAFVSAGDGVSTWTVAAVDGSAASNGAAVDVVTDANQR